MVELNTALIRWDKPSLYRPPYSNVLTVLTGDHGEHGEYPGPTIYPYLGPSFPVISLVLITRGPLLRFSRPDELSSSFIMPKAQKSKLLKPQADSTLRRLIPHKEIFEEGVKMRLCSNCVRRNIRCLAHRFFDKCAFCVLSNKSCDLTVSSEN